MKRRSVPRTFAISGPLDRAIFPGTFASAFQPALSPPRALGRARLADSAHQYVAWLFVLDMLPMLAGVLLVKRRAFAAALATDWRAGLAGGLLSLVAYWIAIWAMTVAPIRAASIALVLCGLALMRL
jgi:hypothetical protein